MLARRSGIWSWIAAVTVACVVVLAGTWTPAGVGAQPIQTPTLTPTAPILINPTVIPFRTPVPTQPPLGVPTNTPVPEPTDVLPTEVSPTDPSVVETEEPETPIEETPAPTDEPTEGVQGGPPPPATSTPATTITVTVYLHKCLDTFVPSRLGAGWTTFAQQCTLDAKQLDVTLGQGSGHTSLYGQTVTSPGGNGNTNSVVFTGVNQRQFGLSVDLSYFYETTSLFCGSGDPGNKVFTPLETTNGSYKAYGIFTPNSKWQTVACHSYAAKNTTGKLILNVQECVEGFYPYQNPDYDANCAPKSGWTFWLTDDDRNRTFRGNPTNQSGVVTFDPIPAATMTVTFRPNTDLWQYSLVKTCSSTSATGTVTTVQPKNINSNGYDWHIPIATGATVSCDWYFVKGTSAGVGFGVLQCPAGYDPGLRSSDPDHDCKTIVPVYLVTLEALDINNEDISGTHEGYYHTFGPVSPGMYVAVLTGIPGNATTFSAGCAVDTLSTDHREPYDENPDDLPVTRTEFPLYVPNSSNIMCRLYVIPVGFAESQMSTLNWAQPIQTPVPPINQPIQQLPIGVPTAVHPVSIAPARIAMQ